MELAYLAGRPRTAFMLILAPTQPAQSERSVANSRRRHDARQDEVRGRGLGVVGTI